MSGNHKCSFGVISDPLNYWRQFLDLQSRTRSSRCAVLLVNVLLSGEWDQFTFLSAVETLFGSDLRKADADDEDDWVFAEECHVISVHFIKEHWIKGRAVCGPYCRAICRFCRFHSRSASLLVFLGGKTPRSWTGCKVLMQSFDILTLNHNQTTSTCK